MLQNLFCHYLTTLSLFYSSSKVLLKIVYVLLIKFWNMITYVVIAISVAHFWNNPITNNQGCAFGGGHLVESVRNPFPPLSESGVKSQKVFLVFSLCLLVLRFQIIRNNIPRLFWKQKENVPFVQDVNSCFGSSNIAEICNTGCIMV